MNTRILKLKKDLVEIRPEICTERLIILTQAYQRYNAYPNIMKRAMALRDILNQMSIYIEDGQLIAGNQASKPRSAPLFPEYSWDWIYQEIDEFEHRASDVFFVSDTNKEIMRRELKYWEGKTLKDRAVVMQSDSVMQDKKVGVLGWEGNVTAGEGHIILDFEKIIRVGFGGIVQEAREHLNELSKTDPDDLRKEAFYKAVITAYEACSEFVGRYVCLAEKLAEDASEDRRVELLQIAENCRAVAVKPPKTFREAVQLVYFVQLISQIEANGHSMSMGRMDRYLMPFYEQDMKKDVLSKEEAKEWIECFYLKLFSIIKLRSWSTAL